MGEHVVSEQTEFVSGGIRMVCLVLGIQCKTDLYSCCAWEGVLSGSMRCWLHLFTKNFQLTIYLLSIQ